MWEDNWGPKKAFSLQIIWVPTATVCYMKYTNTSDYVTPLTV